MLFCDVNICACQNLYAVCDLGFSIAKQLAPKDINLEDLSASVALPASLYKCQENIEGNDKQVCSLYLFSFT